MFDIYLTTTKPVGKKNVKKFTQRTEESLSEVN